MQMKLSLAILVFALMALLIALNCNAQERTPYFGSSYGAEVLHQSGSDLLIFEGGLQGVAGHKYQWRRVGWRAYLGGSNNVPDLGSDMYVGGAEATYTLGRWTLGYGGVYLDNRTARANGTKLNFSLSAFYCLNEYLDVGGLHWSHGAKFGIMEDVNNQGWNMVMFRVTGKKPCRRQ